MSVRVEQTDGVGVEGGEPTGPPLAALPQPCSPKDVNSATALAAPSFKSSRRVRLRMDPKDWMRTGTRKWACSLSDLF